MTTLAKHFLTTLFLTTLALSGLSGCDEGPAESAGEKIDRAVDDAGDAIEDAADEVEDAVDG